ncbi:ABC-2 type transport system ATP-binding protein [Leucobacter exalbidus]|uniref:ABC-2 type transport system ATP-binding protein n=1 Tax=Leucobacter exalbidus TaxID=662960 RepID=A0A940PPZ6_9MICO|nr:ATP-binding cassette domain-containing protein [Leucobacter exalbidus]MBP1325474.1 ABC-2 type transport system ATP-binding protein [Leucobacter exalbidus]
MIEISNLVKRHGSRAVVDNVSFSALPGRVTGLLGPNGAGKSSTMRILLGLDRATSGSALIDGVPYRALQRPLWKVGAMLDGPGANKGRTARAHLRWVAQSNAIPTRRVDEVLELTGLRDADKVRIGGFSLGMGQRLGIAAALLGNPRVLVLDEPTNGLDPDGIRWTRQFLRSLAEEGRAVLVSSHLMSEMEETADDFVIIARGKVLASGTTTEVKGEHRTLEDAFFALTENQADYRATGTEGWGR